MSTRQARVHDVQDVRLDQIDLPAPTGGEAWVRVHACGICGSDLGFFGRGGLVAPGDQPLALGHEISGTVLAMGEQVTGFAIGDPVAVCPLGGGDQVIGAGTHSAGLADVVLVRDADRHLAAVPAGLDLTVAALAEPVAVAMNGVDRLAIQPGEKVVVLGGGTIGLAALACCLDQGAADVVIIEPSAYRRQLALQLGASHALDPADEDVWRQLRHAHGRAAAPHFGASATDAWIEASGMRACIEQFFTRSRVGSRMVVLGLHLDDIPISFLTLLMKQLTVLGATMYPDDFSRALDLLTRRDLSGLISAHRPLSELPAALAQLRSSSDVVKILIRPDGAA